MFFCYIFKHIESTFAMEFVHFCSMRRNLSNFTTLVTAGDISKKLPRINSTQRKEVEETEKENFQAVIRHDVSSDGSLSLYRYSARTKRSGSLFSYSFTLCLSFSVSFTFDVPYLVVKQEIIIFIKKCEQEGTKCKSK